MVLQEEGSRARCHQKLTAKNYRLGCVRLIKSVPDEAVCSAVGGGETCSPNPLRPTTGWWMARSILPPVTQDGAKRRKESRQDAGTTIPNVPRALKHILSFTFRLQ